MPFIFEAIDPRGKRIICTEEAWYVHILDAHPQMEGSEGDVKKAIEQPSYSMIYQDKDYQNRNIYYRKQPGDYYVKAVAEFLKDGHGELITAFITDSPKMGEALLWKPQSSG